MYDLHIHSKYSDGRSGIYEIASKAKEKGLKVIAIVDHSIEHRFGLTEKKAELRQREIEIAKSKYDIEILSGVECGILPNGEIVLPNFKFDFIIASVHEYVTEYEYYRRVLACLEKYEIDVIGHPFSSMFGFSENVRELDLKLLEKIEENGVAIEINSAHRSPPENFLELCKDWRISYSIGSDAHDVMRVGDVAWCMKIAKKYLRNSKFVLNSL